MAVTVITRYARLSRARYDQIVASMRLDAEPAAGAVLHVATPAPEGMVVCEVWRTVESYEAYVHHRLRPALHAHDVYDDPAVRISPLHNLYAPDMDAVERLGAVSTAAQLVYVT